MRLNRAHLIETRSANFIRASGQAPRKQAGHMTAPDRGGTQVRFSLQRRGRPHMSRRGAHILRTTRYFSRFNSRASGSK
jgi:hypothetical protein